MGGILALISNQFVRTRGYVRENQLLSPDNAKVVENVDLICDNHCRKNKYSLPTFFLMFVLFCNMFNCLLKDKHEDYVFQR